ncbi:hypothetical protein CCHR01_04104 [Colletotrichum chrysophilum]|uniref:Uncharacterized protein n=1 Tax=Colletotrichum chrysophilum TaxID=1836956 RepID=A0AAD9ARL3_9PEZI|nr:hypothetical protein CCHR01_04104 [Colletotrichum chrysophilum]
MRCFSCTRGGQGTSTLILLVDFLFPPIPRVVTWIAGKAGFHVRRKAGGGFISVVVENGTAWRELGVCWQIMAPIAQSAMRGTTEPDGSGGGDGCFRRFPSALDGAVNSSPGDFPRRFLISHLVSSRTAGVLCARFGRKKQAQRHKNRTVSDFGDC